MKRFMFAVAALVAALASLSSVAQAKTIKAAAPFYEGNGTCGGTNGGAVIGRAKFERLGNTVSINSFDTKNASPLTDYQIELWGGNCNEIVDFGGFQTNKKGDFSYKESLASPVEEGETTFFATLYNEATGQFSDTTSVSLP